MTERRCASPAPSGGVPTYAATPHTVPAPRRTVIRAAPAAATQHAPRPTPVALTLTPVFCPQRARTRT
eukprot:1332489-Prymnesium_polylepis.1